MAFPEPGVNELTPSHGGTGRSATRLNFPSFATDLARELDWLLLNTVRQSRNPGDRARSPSAAAESGEGAGRFFETLSAASALRAGTASRSEIFAVNARTGRILVRMLLGQRGLPAGGESAPFDAVLFGVQMLSSSLSLGVHPRLKRFSTASFRLS